MTAQVFIPTPRHYDYDKERDLDTTYAVGKGLNEHLSALADERAEQAVLDAERRSQINEMAVAEIDLGKGLFVTEIEVG